MITFGVTAVNTMPDFFATISTMQNYRLAVGVPSNDQIGWLVDEYYDKALLPERVCSSPDEHPRRHTAGIECYNISNQLF